MHCFTYGIISLTISMHTSHDTHVCSGFVQVGVLIEEPFPMLALDELCKVVCNDIQDNIAIQKTIQMHITAKRKTHHREHTPNGWPASSGDKTW